MYGKFGSVLSLVALGVHLSLTAFPVNIDYSSQELQVFGRTIHVPWSSGSLCKFSFSELCGEVRSAVGTPHTSPNFIFLIFFYSPWDPPII